MKLHRNARTTPVSRAQLVTRVLHDGWTYQQAADGGGVSRRTVAKWVRRFREGGHGALEDRTSRPVQIPFITAPKLVAEIRRLRETRGLPAWAIGRAIGVARSTVSAWLRRLGLSRLLAAPTMPVHRDEWPTPGDMLHLDIKPLGRFRRIGHRIHGQRQMASPGAGWAYVHVAVDDHSRLAYVEVCRDQYGSTCAAFLRRAVAWFAGRGISIQRVLTDNGSGYLSAAFASACTELVMRHRRTRPYTPRTNGKAERFMQTLLREWAYVQAYNTSQERRRALRPWLMYYNRQRPHASLDYQTPWSRLQGAA
jgi:transposase InsO family protein